MLVSVEYVLEENVVLQSMGDFEYRSGGQELLVSVEYIRYWEENVK